MERTLLIVDDSERIREHVQHTLSRAQVFTQFLHAPDGAAAYKILASQAVDLVLCDVEMPGMDGLKFLALKSKNDGLRDIPVIMLTSQEGVKDKVGAFEAGASDYLTKPFHDAELIARSKVHLKLKLLHDELRLKNARLEELSNTDELTKTANRRHFLDMLALEFHRAQRYSNDLAYVMIDIDHFKRINDRHGHIVGDRALVIIADVLKKSIRVHDVLGRYGGEEFGLILPQTNLAGAHRVAERCRQRVAEASMTTPEGDVQMTISLGIAAYPREGVDSVDNLVELADEALYGAKAMGRNRIVLVE